MIGLLENIYQISGVVLLLCAVYYYFHFRRIKRKRKLTKVEFSFYIITQIAFLLCAGSYLLMILDKVS
ncbi:hypothetical protein [Gracilibacillus salinarum]|uniref:Uncharacterized protein n=1 Tax=Gracilibacillus salinarum TaxID=2932255 RepID=A0ABY4GGW4_9BACI|nr:hypothetical protein [Gracilibacillus salinarum]UOQ83560.1 hypothetical protein MUN87_12415 [Gracilibacillus salinarum]